MLFWRIPAPNEALLISGSKHRRQDTQFRIVTGHGSFVIPIKQRARLLSLALQEAEIVEDCITNQGIRLNVRAVAAFKVGDDSVSIANAARRFLSEQDRMEVLVGRVFAGHLRSIIGGLTVEQIISDQAAAEQEQQAAAMKAQYERDLRIKQSGFLAETEEARARAAQAGPLAEARASQEVIEQQTALAQRRADLAAQRLEAEVRRPADAEAYKQRTLAEAERDQAKFTAEGDAYRRTTVAAAEAEAAKIQADAAAYAERTTASAQADANRSRAASLADGNQELIAASRIVEALPSLVAAAAQGIANSNLTILNGTEGVSQVVAGLVGQGLSILDTLRNATAAASRNGSVPASAAVATDRDSTQDVPPAEPTEADGVRQR